MWPASQAVYPAEYVDVAVRRRERAHEINVYVIRKCLGVEETSLWSLGVSLDFGSLVLEEVVRPLAYVTFDVEPHETLSQLPERRTATRVGDVV